MDEARKHQSITVSERLMDGRLVELVYLPTKRLTQLAVGKGAQTELVTHFDLDGQTCVPLQAGNNLVSHRVVLLPEQPEKYGSVQKLISDIEAYLHQYVDLSSRFEVLAARYVLLTWVYDAFQELPYLRFRGDFGSGKTRALKVLGAICNKPFFASGASTVSPLFHVLDTFRGTLLFDEADFRYTDEKAELIKIFNNGNAKGFPVLRSAVSARRDFEPRAFHVFGPKVIAMRRSFDDHALESRFLTEEMGQRSLRKDIPLNLPDTQEKEAKTLRNKLLQYRFDHFHRTCLSENLADPSLSPRINQILAPLLSLIDEEAIRQDLRDAVRASEGKLYATRSASMEGQVLEVIAALFAASDRPNVPVADIAQSLQEKFGSGLDRPVSSRFVGSILRDRLHLATYKSHGIYVVPRNDVALAELCRRFGIAPTASVASA